MIKKVLCLLFFLLLFFSCASTPEPGQLDTTTVEYVQFGAENISDQQASFIGFISTAMDMHLILGIDNTMLSDYINGARDVRSGYGMPVSRNAVIKMIPGEYSFDHQLYLGGAGAGYNLTLSNKMKLEPGMVYYLYPIEDGKKMVQDMSKYAFDVYYWPVGQEGSMQLEQIAFDLESKSF